MNLKNPVEVYNQRIKQFNLELKDLKKRDVSLGILKLSWALIGVIGILRVFSQNQAINLSIFGTCLVLFILTAWFHEKVIKKVNRFKTLITIDENEQRVLQYEFPERSYSGTEFKNGDHNYSSDMDIFGDKGIFHFINRGVTAMGRKCLANWFQQPGTLPEIHARQEAVTELSPKLDLRHGIISHGMTLDDSSTKLNALQSFLVEPNYIFGKKFLEFFIYFWPVITLGSLAAIAIGIPVAVFLGLVLSQLLINKYFLKPVSHLYRSTNKSFKILKAYSCIFLEIEKEKFSSTHLLTLKERLFVKGKMASVCIRRLSTLLEWFDTRLGMFHFIVNNIFFLDLHCMYRIEKWRKENAVHVPDWFNVIGEFEALSSLACLKFNNPSWVMPEIVEGPFCLEAVNIGHPLLKPEERICNDISFGGEGNGSIAIITGPNMAGKSTFLRTVGVGIIMALAGAPVCAEKFRVSVVKLITSMQTSDSLDKHLSLFYAELQRLKMIIDGIAGKEPIFFIIDEMLKGTNALDRQKGAIAMVKQLMRSRSNGITATHDLELTKLDKPDEWKKNNILYPVGIEILNYHFDGYIEGDKLLFDYKLKTGICESFNALVLMKNMGIDL